MEAVLWYVLTGTRGGENRTRTLKTVGEQPRNANQLAETLDLDYKTVRRHLDAFMNNDVVQWNGDDYDAVYLPLSRRRVSWEAAETIVERMD